MGKIERTEKIIKRLLLGISLSFLIYTIGLAGIQALSQINSPKIRTQSQLEKQLLIERERLGMDKNIVIIASIGNISFAKRDDKGSKKYEIVLGNEFSNLSTLKHELYHIYDGHCNAENLTNIQSRLRYFFWDEPQATIYQTTGLKP